MEIKIGILHGGRELSVALDPKSEIGTTIDDLAADLDNGRTLKLVDATGRTTIVPADRVAYIEVRPEAARTVGFGEV